MKKEYINDLIKFSRSLNEEYELLVKDVSDPEFKNIDPLNQDLMITELNTLRSLLGIVTIRLGLSSYIKNEKTDTSSSNNNSKDYKQNTVTNSTIENIQQCDAKSEKNTGQF